MSNSEKKEMLDRMNILEKADLIKSKAEKIKEENRTLSYDSAYKIASREVLEGSTWNY